MQLLLIFCLFLLLIELQMKINISCWWKMIFFWKMLEHFCSGFSFITFSNSSRILSNNLRVKYCIYGNSEKFPSATKLRRQIYSWFYLKFYTLVFRSVDVWVFYILQRFMCFYFFSDFIAFKLFYMMCYFNRFLVVLKRWLWM